MTRNETNKKKKKSHSDKKNAPTRTKKHRKTMPKTALDSSDPDMLMRFVLDKTLAQNDFYSFINQGWVTPTSSKYLNRVDNVRVTQYKVFDELYAILRTYIQRRSNHRVADELKHFFDSSMRFNSISNSKAYLKKMVQHIDTLRSDKANVWSMLAWVNRNDLTNAYGPFQWRKAPDFKEPMKQADYVLPHQFAIFDVHAYEYEDQRVGYRTLFKKYVQTLFQTTLPKEGSLRSNDVLDVAQRFFSLLFQEKYEANGRNTYTKVTRHEALATYGFDWDAYATAMGYATPPAFFYVENLDFFQSCTQMLMEEWNSEKWRSYWVWLVARYVARLTDRWERIFYTFYGAEAQGLASSIRATKQHAVVNSCLYAFGGLLNNEYIDYAHNEANTVYTQRLATSLRDVLMDQLERNTWLEPKTRRYARFKIAHVGMEIGSAKFPHPVLPLLGFAADDYLGNFLKVAEWRHRLYIHDRQDVIRTLTVLDFTKYPAQIVNMPSFHVNAAYSAQTNTIQVTTAYMQKPFLNLDEEGTEYNLANMGFTIAHELTHALDNIGSRYDHRGAFRDWWSKRDRERYDKRQKEIVRQYEAFAKDDKYFKHKDFALTLDEDIADISGLHICEEYLRDYCLRNKWSPLITYYHFRLFYVYFAYNMRQKIEKQSTRYQLVTNPHPIDKYRTNVPLARSAIFQQVFEVKKGDGMYWDNQENIWE